MVAGTVKITIFFFALRALCLRLSFKRKARKKNECAIDGEEFFFLFALRALCPRLSFKRKARKKNECAINGEEKKLCASRLVHAPKVQRESVKKKHCAIDGEEFFFFLRSALCARV